MSFNGSIGLTGEKKIDSCPMASIREEGCQQGSWVITLVF